MEEVRCPVCGNDITEHPDYCPECGFHPLDFSESLSVSLEQKKAEPSKMQPYTTICWRCGAHSSADVMYCPYCGMQKSPVPDSYVSRSRDGFDKHPMANRKGPYGADGLDKHSMANRKEPYGADGLDKHPEAYRIDPIGADDLDKHPVNKKGTSGKAGILLAAALIVLIAIIVLVILR